MFLKHDDTSGYADFSSGVRDLTDWKIGTLREFEFPLDTTSVAFDPILGLLAIGTARGNIHIHGGPNVESKLRLPEDVLVRFLLFASPTEKLVCLDDRNFMHVWDLSPLGIPKYLATVRWDPVTFMILSPSHNHIFLAMGNGDLRTYDMACMRKSPYAVHNMWQIYEEQRLKSGLSSIPLRNPKPQAVEILPHPRDLALLFIAYDAGVVLWDLKERNTIHTYELIYPAGAPGGTGYISQDILTVRRSSITSIAIHPAGHFFVTGHTDGSFAFWAVEAADEPILVRTLDDLDVNLVDTHMLDAHLGEIKASEPGSNTREPIFKLTWSGFSNSKDSRGGETALTILGGFNRGDGPGLTTLWFPAFNPADPPSDSTASMTQSHLHPFMVDAIRQSLIEKHSYVYSTDAPVQDFYLVPRGSPHFNYSYDAHAILMLVETEHDERALISQEFPPPLFTQGQQMIQTKETPTDESDLNDLDDMLQSLSIVDSPQSVSLPYGLCGARFAADTYQIHVLPKEMYSEYIKDDHSGAKKPRLRLLGGLAQMEPFTETKRKFQPHRIAIFATLDLTVHFYDMSDQLLQETGGAPLKHDFPEAIDELEIDLRPVLGLVDSERYLHPGQNPVKVITEMHLAVGSMECAIVLSTGELFVYRSRSTQTAQGANGFQDRELKSLTHISVKPWKSFVPYFALVAPERGGVQTVAISEIGFVAISFTGGSLFIVDMRGPDVLYRSTKSRRRSSRLSRLSFSHPPEGNIVATGATSLTWVISRTDKDPKAGIRLIALQASGDMIVYTVSHSRSGFAVEDPITVNKVAVDPLREGMFVINSKNGSICRADKGHFAEIVHFGGGESQPVIFITAGAKSVRSYSNITGERLGKADWNSKYGKVIDVQIVERLGSRVLVAYTDKSALHIYSLPHLEHVFTIPALSTPLRSIRIDENGDFISLESDQSSGSVRSAVYGTLFNFRRIDELPLLDLISTKKTMPMQPQPVSMGPSSYLSWFSSKQVMSGSQIDELLGGPGRPQPVKRARDIVPKKDEATPELSSIMSTAAATQSNIYSRLASALDERGQLLGELEENFKSLEQSSKDMVSHARTLAAKSAAKSWFKF